MFPCLFIFLSSVLQSVKVLLVLCLHLVAPGTNSSSRFGPKFIQSFVLFLIVQSIAIFLFPLF